MRLDSLFTDVKGGSDFLVGQPFGKMANHIQFPFAKIWFGFGVIISSLTTKYRDLRFLVTFGVQLWMYATPVIYPVSSIPEELRPLILANPVTPIVEAFRYAFLGSGTVNIGHLLYSFLFMVVIVILGTIIFNRVEQSFMDTV